MCIYINTCCTNVLLILATFYHQQHSIIIIIIIMSKSPALRRIQADVRELKFNPSPRYFAAPLEDDMFEWHFTIRGPRDTEFEGGVYHGRILVSFI